jgi:hypothetical protein
MTESEWRTATDAYQMLESLWRLPHQDVVGLRHHLHGYYLGCCRVIWKLLPEDSQRGVEVYERSIVGRADKKEMHQADYDSEGAAFAIDYDSHSEEVARWVERVRAIPMAELRTMLHPPGAADAIEPLELLKRAAYFANYAMRSPWIGPRPTPRPHHALFLSASLLREFVKEPHPWHPKLS